MMDWRWWVAEEEEGVAMAVVLHWLMSPWWSCVVRHLHCTVAVDRKEKRRRSNKDETYEVDTGASVRVITSFRLERSQQTGCFVMGANARSSPIDAHRNQPKQQAYMQRDELRLFFRRQGSVGIDITMNNTPRINTVSTFDRTLFCPFSRPLLMYLIDKNLFRGQVWWTEKILGIKLFWWDYWPISDSSASTSWWIGIGWVLGLGVCRASNAISCTELEFLGDVWIYERVLNTLWHRLWIVGDCVLPLSSPLLANRVTTSSCQYSS